MRRLLGKYRISWKRTLSHADFITGHLIGPGLVYSVIAIAVFHAFFIAFSGPRVFTDLSIFFVLTAVIYALLSGLTMASMAGDLEEEYALLYLIHPLRRIEYFLAWLTSGPLLVILSYLLSILVPVLALTPSSLLNTGIITALTAVLGQLFFHSSLIVAASIIYRERSRVYLAVISTLIILPVIAVVAVEMIMSLLHISLSGRTMTYILGVFYPAILYYGITPGSSASFALSIFYSVMVATAIYWFSAKRFIEKMDL